MADVFLSYAKENRADVERLATALAEEGLEVFWDAELRVGETWRKELSDRLDEARVVVVIWSNASVASHYVIEEAEEGRDRGILCPVLLETVARLPFGFRGLQTQNLGGWDGHPDDEAFCRLVEAIRARLRAGPTAAPERGETTSIAVDQRELLRLLGAAYGAGLLIVCASLYLAYGVTAGKAWTVEFGWALRAWPPPGWPEVEPRSLGWLWEGLRAVAAMAGSALFFLFATPAASQEILGLRTPALSRRRWLGWCRGIGVVTLLIGAPFLVHHHLSVGPEELAGGGQIWKHQPEYADAPKAAGDEGYFDEYRRPYLWYMAYSSVVFLLIGVPFLTIALYATGMELYRGRSWRKTLDRRMRQAEACPSLAAVFEVGCVRKTEAIERHSYAAMALAVMVSFEIWIGQYTLSQAATVWAWFAYALLAIAILVIASYVAIYVPLARRAHLRALDLECGGEPKRYIQRSQGLGGFYRRILQGCWPFKVAGLLLLITAFARPVASLLT